MAIRVLTPFEASQRLSNGAVLVDVRADHERALGMAEGARGIERTLLEAAAHMHLPDPGAEVLLICQSGQRSHRAAQALALQGYRNLASVEGGTSAWQAAGLPMVEPGIDADFSERYSRHLRLPEVGLDGQRRLEAARVLVVGAGGLGSPAAGAPGAPAGAKVVAPEDRKQGEIFREVEPEDLLKYGLIPEFVGRLPVVATLEDLDEASLKKILVEPKNALVKQYQRLFEMESIDLTLAEEALGAIARKAIDRKTGARGLRSIMEGILLDTMFDLPSLEGVEEVVISKEVVEGTARPLYIYADRSDRTAETGSASA